MRIASNHPIGPALKQCIFVPPIFRHRAARAHVLDVHGTLDVRTQVVEYRVAIKRTDESRHFNYGKPYTLPMKFGKNPLGPWNL